MATTSKRWTKNLEQARRDLAQLIAERDAASDPLARARLAVHVRICAARVAEFSRVSS